MALLKFIYLFVYLFICLFIYLFIYLFIFKAIIGLVSKRSAAMFNHVVDNDLCLGHVL